MRSVWAKMRGDDCEEDNEDLKTSPGEAQRMPRPPPPDPKGTLQCFSLLFFLTDLLWDGPSLQ